MKGAMAEPWASTIRPPNRTSMTSIGRSQNFFRTLRKFQNSVRKAMAVPLKLVLEGGGAVRALDPVGLGGGIAFQPQRIGAAQTQQPARRYDGEDVQHAQYDRTDDAVKYFAKARP